MLSVIPVLLSVGGVRPFGVLKFSHRAIALTLPVICRRPNVTIHVYPKPQPGGGQVLDFNEGTHPFSI